MIDSGKFPAVLKNYEFKSELCEKNGFNAPPVYVEPREPTAPFPLYAAHIQYCLHSRFINIDWMKTIYSEPSVFIHPAAVREKGIAEGDMVRVFNNIGEVNVRAKFSNARVHKFIFLETEISTFSILRSLKLVFPIFPG